MEAFTSVELEVGVPSSSGFNVAAWLAAAELPDSAGLSGGLSSCESGWPCGPVVVSRLSSCSELTAFGVGLVSVSTSAAVVNASAEAGCPLFRAPGRLGAKVIGSKGLLATAKVSVSFGMP